MGPLVLYSNPSDGDLATYIRGRLWVIVEITVQGNVVYAASRCVSLHEKGRMARCGTILTLATGVGWQMHIPIGLPLLCDMHRCRLRKQSSPGVFFLP